MQLPCAKCVSHCKKPFCAIRCPKAMCEKNSCPKCETICNPAQCHTTCDTPPPQCAVVCEKTKCDWKCRKPDNCPKKKCKIKCEKPECEKEKEKKEDGESCCNCKKEAALQAAMRRANQDLDHEDKGILYPFPSFLESMSEMHLREQSGLESMCCPCEFMVK